jgi:sec-independent protein translocase protein TatA
MVDDRPGVRKEQIERSGKAALLTMRSSVSGSVGYLESMLGDIGPLEIGIVLVIALLVFGPKKLPELGNGLGRGIREFKDSVTGEKPETVEADAPKVEALAPSDRTRA